MSSDKSQAKNRLDGLLRKKKKGINVPLGELSAAYKAAGVEEPKKKKPSAKKKAATPKKEPEKKEEEKKDD